MISEDTRKELKSYIEAQDDTVDRFCPECGKKCIEGQGMWNGWYTGEGLYHWDCRPEKYKQGAK